MRFMELNYFAVDPSSTEFAELANYLQLTLAPTHRLIYNVSVNDRSFIGFYLYLKVEVLC